MPSSNPDNCSLHNYFVNSDNCWIWTGAVNEGGTPVVRDQQSRNWTSPRRKIWINHTGQVPYGALRTICRVQLCVNPSHAFDRSAWMAHDPPKVPGVCRIDGCNTSPAKHQGMCSKHAHRLERRGSVTAEPITPFGSPLCQYGHPKHPGSNGRLICRECKRLSQQRRRQRKRLGPDVAFQIVTPAMLAVRDGWRCQGCDGPVDPSVRWPDDLCATVDHIIPLSQGGLHTMTNLQIMHWKCNRAKGRKVA